MQVEVFKRYLVKTVVLLWVAMMGLFILPPTMWMMFGLVVAMPAMMMWENFKRDRCLDEDFGQFYYNEYFSVTGETGKFRIINRQFRSYYEMLDRIASQPETIRFRQKEILVVDDETVIAVAEFESPCRMALFFRSFYQHFVVPQIVARGMIEY